MRLILIPAFLLCFIFLSCGDKNPTSAENPDPPELTDPIPYDKLGSGTIVFERTGPKGMYRGVYVIDVDNRQSWAINFHSLSNDFRVSPDGQNIAFSMFTDFDNLYDVYISDIDGSNIQQLSNLPDHDNSPSWSPDGRRIFFTSFDKLYFQSSTPNASEAILIREMLLPSDQQGIWWIIVPSGAVSVSWNEQITFISNGSQSYGLAGLHTMDMNGENLDQLVKMDDGDAQWDSPIFSPDGKKIAYVDVFRDSHFNFLNIDIMSFDMQERNLERIASLPTTGSEEWAYGSGTSTAINLTWSPDGSKILVNVPQGDLESHLFLLNSDGSDITQVTFAEGVTDRFVSWGR